MHEGACAHYFSGGQICTFCGLHKEEIELAQQVARSLRAPSEELLVVNRDIEASFVITRVDESSANALPEPPADIPQFMEPSESLPSTCAAAEMGQYQTLWVEDRAETLI